MAPDRGTKMLYDGSAHDVFMLPEAPRLTDGLVDFVQAGGAGR